MLELCYFVEVHAVYCCSNVSNVSAGADQQKERLGEAHSAPEQ